MNTVTGQDAYSKTMDVIFNIFSVVFVCLSKRGGGFQFHGALSSFRLEDQVEYEMGRRPPDRKEGESGHDQVAEPLLSRLGTQTSTFKV